MTRAAESQEGYSGFGGGIGKAWLRVFAPYDPALKTGAGLADKPGGLILEAVSDAGVVTTYWLWIDANGVLHSKTSEPTNQDETTSIMAPKNITVSTIGIDPNASLPAGTVIEVATTITGVAVGDVVMLEVPALTGLTPNASVFMITQVARVTTDTITVKFYNAYIQAVISGPRTYRYFWFDLT